MFKFLDNEAKRRPYLSDSRNNKFSFVPPAFCGQKTKKKKRWGGGRGEAQTCTILNASAETGLRLLLSLNPEKTKVFLKNMGFGPLNLSR